MYLTYTVSMYNNVSTVNALSMAVEMRSKLVNNITGIITIY